MTEHPYTAADLAEKVGYKDARTAREKAKALGLGLDLKGRAGYRYSDADVARLLESLKPQQVQKRRKPKRGRAA